MRLARVRPGLPWLLLLVFLAIFLSAQWVGRAFDRMENYPGGRGFPVLLDSKPGQPPNIQREMILSRLPLDPAVLSARPSPMDLPEWNPDPGLMRNDYIDYRYVRTDGRKIVEIRQYRDGFASDWVVARYAITPEGVEPLSIAGGGGGVSLLCSLASACMAALLVAWFMRRRAPALRVRSESTLPQDSTSSDWPWIALLLAPFAYYAIVLCRLTPDVWADSVTYLWRHPVTIDIFVSRSITQRLLFRIVGSGNPTHVALIQLVAFACSCVGLFVILRGRSRAQNAIVSIFLLLLFSGYLLNMSAIAIGAEPIVIALLLVFPVLLLSGRGRRWAAWTLFIGVLFIFCKNIAPPLTLALLGCAVALDLLRPALRPAGAFRVYAILGIVALISFAHTLRVDQSLHINAMANVQRRFLPEPEAERFLIDRYGLPEGPYLNQLRGLSVLTELDGSLLFSIDAQTLDFRLTEDKHGYADWIRSRGRRACLDYLLRGRTVRTFREYITSFAEAARSYNLAFMPEHLGPAAVPGAEPNRKILARHAVNDRAGFLGFDPFRAMQPVLLRLGFGNVWSVVLIGMFALALLRFTPHPAALRPALGLLAMGLVCFFMTHFGDEPNDERHDFPAFLSLNFGALLLILSCGEIAVSALVRRFGPKRASALGPS